ncbi:MAG: Zn-ribbon-containing protein [Bacteroidetes bacterium]|nr:Zn-ribbon-containing protein [Bacteroidota bacterium]
MYKQKLSISINSSFDRTKLCDEFEILMSNLCKTGQIIGSYETPFITENELIAYQTTLEDTSLSEKYYDEYTAKRIRDIENWCNSTLRTEVIGKAISDHRGACQCKKPDLYVLFTHALNDTGFLECGTCNQIVPLYKLAQLNHDDRHEMLSWETNYKSCDNLQLNCTVGEKWATMQMSDPKSSLSKQGIAICQRIWEATEIPTYYYLHNYRRISLQKDKERLCPSCHGNWLLKEPLLDFYDFKCEKCKLLSTFSPVAF